MGGSDSSVARRGELPSEDDERASEEEEGPSDVVVWERSEAVLAPERGARWRLATSSAALSASAGRADMGCLPRAFAERAGAGASEPSSTSDSSATPEGDTGRYCGACSLCKWAIAGTADVAAGCAGACRPLAGGSAGISADESAPDLAGKSARNSAGRLADASAL